MIKPVLVFLAFNLISCSHMQKVSYSVTLPFNQNLLREVLEQRTSGRFPASFGKAGSVTSSRRVYFRSLYYQYRTLNESFASTSGVQFCPQFHHDKIAVDGHGISTVSLFSPGIDKETKMDLFPELAFSHNFSVRDQLNEIKSEIETLCEDGTSDNYYKFDNLVTHYAQDRAFHSKPEAMNSILKIPVFANYYLIKMLQTPQRGTSTFVEENNFISLTRTEWFETYITRASQLRSNYIQNKMVQR